MSASKLVTEVEQEPQTQRDARIQKLWKKLEPSSSGELDLAGLKKGFRKLDHRKHDRSIFHSLART